METPGMGLTMVGGAGTSPSPSWNMDSSSALEETAAMSWREEEEEEEWFAAIASLGEGDPLPRMAVVCKWGGRGGSLIAVASMSSSEWSQLGGEGWLGGLGWFKA